MRWTFRPRVSIWTETACLCLSHIEQRWGKGHRRVLICIHCRKKRLVTADDHAGWAVTTGHWSDRLGQQSVLTPWVKIFGHAARVDMQMRPPLAYQRSSKLHRMHTACYRAAKFYSERRKPFLDWCSLSEAASGGDLWLWRCNFTTGRSPLSTTAPGGGARRPGRSPLAFPWSPLCNQAVTKSSARYISTSAFLEYEAVLFFNNLFLFVTMVPNLVQRHLSTISQDHFCLLFQNFIFLIFYI